jgi:ABC-type multidrug transport system ATPase subunit
VSYYASEERLALLGHNGAGKSTTFGLLSSQLTADSGEVFLEGGLRMPWETRLNSAGICYQEDALWEGLLVHEVFTVASWMIPVRNSERE